MHVGAEREARIVVAEESGQRPDIHPVGQQGAGEVMPQRVHAVLGASGTPAPRRAGCPATALKLERCSAAPPGSVNTSRTVTGLPSGVFHGSVTGTGGKVAMCTLSSSATESASGMSRSFPALRRGERHPGAEVRGRTSVSVIRSSRCQCTGQVGVRGGCAQSLELVMILAVWWLGARRLKGRLPAVGHAPGAGVDDHGGSARWRSRSRHCVGDDLADHRLRPAHVRGGFPYGERAREREVLEHCPGRARQLAPGPVPSVKGQVDGTEEVGEPFGPRPFIGHATRVAAGASIVNPDGSAAPASSAAAARIRARDRRRAAGHGLPGNRPSGPRAPDWRSGDCHSRGSLGRYPGS